VTRTRRFPLVVLLASALAATGLCTFLSAGAATSCPVTEAPEHDGCCDQESNEACPDAPARPTCRMCDDTVAFLLKEKTAGDDVPSAIFALAPTLAPRPDAVIPGASDSLHLLSLSASPPIHLLNVTFRN
jgi:hypothetical protein